MCSTCHFRTSWVWNVEGSCCVKKNGIRAEVFGHSTEWTWIIAAFITVVWKGASGVVVTNTKSLHVQRDSSPPAVLSPSPLAFTWDCRGISKRKPSDLALYVVCVIVRVKKGFGSTQGFGQRCQSLGAEKQRPTESRKINAVRQSNHPL